MLGKSRVVGYNAERVGGGCLGSGGGRVQGQESMSTHSSFVLFCCLYKITHVLDTELIYKSF